VVVWLSVFEKTENLQFGLGLRTGIQVHWKWFVGKGMVVFNMGRLGFELVWSEQALIDDDLHVFYERYPLLRSHYTHSTTALSILFANNV